jgi:hypothetical protein
MIARESDVVLMGASCQSAATENAIEMRLPANELKPGKIRMNFIEEFILQRYSLRNYKMVFIV